MEIIAKMMHRSPRRTSGSATSHSASTDNDNDEDRKLRSRAASKETSKRRSNFREHRKDTQDILNEPSQFMEKLLQSGVFGPDIAEYVGYSSKHNPGNIIKEGELEKQGNFFKTWHKRYFVLSNRGLSYYNDREKFRKNYLPLGVILFKDIQQESGNVVHDVPEHLIPALHLAGKRNLFCVHLEKRTYVMSASSTDDKDHWAKAITQAFHSSQQVHATLQRAPRKKRSPGQSLSIAEEFDSVRKKEEIDAIFEQKLVQLRSHFQTARVFSAWKVYAAYCKKTGKGYKSARPGSQGAATSPSSGHHRRKSSALGQLFGF